MSFFRRSGAAIARFFTSAADPAAVAGEFKLYSKDDTSSESQLYGRSDNGTVYQITPPAVGGSQCLVFKPGSGLAGPVVFDTWAALYTRLTTLRAQANGEGCYTIEFDPTAMAIYSDMTIPAGAYDMNHVTWTGFNTGVPAVSSAPTTVYLADGSTFTGMRNFQGINVTGQTTGTPHFTFSSPWLDIVKINYANMSPSAVPLFAMTGGGGVLFIIENSAFGDGSINAVVTVGAPGSYANLRLGPGANVPALALETTGDGSIGLEIYGSSASFSEDQPAAAGFDLTGSDVNYTYTRHYTDDNGVPGGYVQTDQPVSLFPGYLTQVNAAGADNTAFQSDLPQIADRDTRYRQVLIKETSFTAGAGLYANGAGLVVAPFGAETIDGIAAATLLQPDQSMLLISDGASNWTSFKSPGAMDRRFAGVVINPAGGGSLRLSQFNVSAVAKPATGTYTVTFTSPIPAGFIPNVQVTVANPIGVLLVPSYAEVDASNITVYVQDVTSTGNDGANRISVSVFLDPELLDLG